MLCYMHAEKDIQFKICHNVTRTPLKEEKLIILDEYHNGKPNSQRIKWNPETNKLGIPLLGLTKDVGTFIRKWEICQGTKICSKNWNQPMVITENPKTHLSEEP